MLMPLTQRGSFGTYRGSVPVQQGCGLQHSFRVFPEPPESIPVLRLLAATRPRLLLAVLLPHCSAAGRGSGWLTSVTGCAEGSLGWSFMALHLWAAGNRQMHHPERLLAG